MSLRLFFEKKDVHAISDQQTGLVSICAVRGDVGGLFYTDAFRATDVLAMIMPADVLAKVAYASVKESWVGSAVRQPGEYQLGEAHVSVAYHETDRWVANNTVYGSSKNLADLIELLHAIRVDNAQRFLRRDYGKPQGGPSYAELEAQLAEASSYIQQLNESLEKERQTAKRCRLMEHAAEERHFVAQAFLVRMRDIIRNHFWANREFCQLKFDEDYQRKLMATQKELSAELAKIDQ